MRESPNVPLYATTLPTVTAEHLAIDTTHFTRQRYECQVFFSLFFDCLMLTAFRRLNVAQTIRCVGEGVVVGGGRGGSGVGWGDAQDGTAAGQTKASGSEHWRQGQAALRDNEDATKSSKLKGSGVCRGSHDFCWRFYPAFFFFFIQLINYCSRRSGSYCASPCHCYCRCRAAVAVVVLAEC